MTVESVGFGGWDVLRKVGDKLGWGRSARAPGRMQGEREGCRAEWRRWIRWGLGERDPTHHLQVSEYKKVNQLI